MESDPQPKYRRILLKLSGEILAGSKSFGIESKSFDYVCSQVKEIAEIGSQIAIVIGGGNIFRGLHAADTGMDRVNADKMGMLATVINAIALRDGLENVGLTARVLSAVRIDAFVEPYTRARAARQLEKGRIVILAAGTGNPFFSTDTAAALRASELQADIIFKATKVDGVYSEDPVKNPDAEYYPELSFMDVVNKDLKVMDLTAVTMCRDNKIPILVFDMHNPGSLKRAAKGEKFGSLIS